MTPECDYTGNRPSQSVISRISMARRLGCGRRAIGCISEVARWAIRKKRKAFEGMCRLKSTRLCTRKPLQATRPESCTAAAKELLSWRNRLKDELNKTHRNQAHQNPPQPTVSPWASTT